MGQSCMRLLRRSQHYSRVPALQQLPQREQFILGIPPALPTRTLLFQRHHLQSQPGANAHWLIEVSKVWVGIVGALPGARAGCYPRVSLAPVPGTATGEAKCCCRAVPPLRKPRWQCPKQNHEQQQVDSIPEPSRCVWGCSIPK